MPDDPLALLNHRFTVNIESERPEHSRRDLAFTSVTGLGSPRKRWADCLFSFLHRRDCSRRLELRRAMGSDRFFFDWHRANHCRITDLRSVILYQLEPHSEQPLNGWRLDDCWVQTWRGPDFDAMNPDVAYETLTLCYGSLSWLTAKDLT